MSKDWLLTPEQLCKVIDKTLQQIAKEDKLRGHAREGFMLMFTEGGETLAIAQDVAKAQLAKVLSHQNQEMEIVSMPKRYGKKRRQDPLLAKLQQKRPELREKIHQILKYIVTADSDLVTDQILALFPSEEITEKAKQEEREGIFNELTKVGLLPTKHDKITAYLADSVKKVYCAPSCKLCKLESLKETNE